MENYLINTPIGWLCIKGDEEHVHEVSFGPGDLVSSGNRLLKMCAEQMEAYFLGKLKKFDVPIALYVSAFQEKVLNVVGEIPFGETRSYLYLAHLLGDPKAVRAIGNANGKNPLPIIIPCHRVIGSNGSLIGYAGGIMRKKWLLQHESGLIQLPLFPSSLS